MSSEAEIQSEIIHRFRALGWWIDRRNSGGRRAGAALCEPGTPDLWTPWGYLEVKAPGKTLSTTQVCWHARARNNGVRVATVTSATEAVDVVRGWRADVCAACRR